MPAWQIAPVILGRTCWEYSQPVDWPMRGLTRRQCEVLIYLIGYSRAYRSAPTAREICQHLGLSSASTAIHHLQALQDKGWLQRAGHRQAAIRLIPPAHLQVRCEPLLVA